MNSYLIAIVRISEFVKNCSEFLKTTCYILYYSIYNPPMYHLILSSPDFIHNTSTNFIFENQRQFITPRNCVEWNKMSPRTPQQSVRKQHIVGWKWPTLVLNTARLPRCSAAITQSILGYISTRQLRSPSRHANVQNLAPHGKHAQCLQLSSFKSGAYG